MSITKLARIITGTCVFLGGYFIFGSWLKALLVWALFVGSYFLGAISLKYDIDHEDN